MTTKEILERLGEDYPDALLADGFHEAIVGVAAGWFGDTQRTVVCYDYEMIIRILMDRDGMEMEEAIAFCEFNIFGAFMGKDTPVFLYNWRKEDTL